MGVSSSMTGAARRSLTIAATTSFPALFILDLVLWEIGCSIGTLALVFDLVLWAMGWSNLTGWFTLGCKGLRVLFTLGACCILGPRALSTLGACLSIVAGSSLSIFSLDSLLQLPSPM